MRLSDSTVLVVEDEPILLEMTSKWFEREGCRVLTAENGVPAFEQLTSTKVDLIVTDIRMPRVDGISLLQSVKVRGIYTPSILFVSSDSDMASRDACDLGVEATFPKPVVRPELISAAERILSEKRLLWSAPWRGGRGALLSAAFASLSSALRSGQIAFGSGGFSLESDFLLQDEPVELAIEFVAEACKIGGCGFVRWSSPRDRRVGIEIARLDDAARDWVIHQTSQNSTVSFIPRAGVCAVTECGVASAGDLSHELSNLLAVVIAYSNACQELLRPDDPVHNYVEQIRVCAERASGLVRQGKGLATAASASTLEGSASRISDQKAS
jgi:CheY-like chemotaxis protein